mmetsp:Transcript_3600/g.7957  ORF Transcript_3600/g.7957 Transcript_3600/m.7957 type:complete len:1436 (+) Transcript_3600:181-4488(+)
MGDSTIIIPNDDANHGIVDNSQRSKKSESSTAVAAEKSGPQVASLSEIFSLSTAKPRTRPFIVMGLAGAFVSGLVFPAMAFLFAQVFEKFAVPSASDSFMDGIREMAYAFMALGVIVFLSMSIQNTLLDAAAADMAHTFKISYLSLLLQQDTAYFDLTDVAGTASMIEGEGNKIKKGVGRKMGEGFQFFITMIGGFAYGFYSSWKVSLVILTTLPFMSISALFLMRMVASQSSAASEGYEKAGEIAYAAVSAIRTILSLNAVGVTIDKYKGATKEACDTATKREWALGLANGAVMGSMLLGYIAITLFGMWVLYDAVMNTGCDPSNAVPYNEPCPTTGMDVLGSLMGISFAAMGLPQISGAAESMVSARGAAYPVFVLKRRCDGDYNDDFDPNVLLDDSTVGGTAKKVFSEKDRVSTNEESVSAVSSDGEKEDLSLDSMETTHHKKRIPASKMPPYRIDCSSESGLKPTLCNGTIKFSNVTFSYPSRPQAKVLDGLSLHVESGKTVALVGKSGCGKSSIMNLMERFYDVDSYDTDDDVEQGKYANGIQLDGVDLRDLNVKWLRSQIGLVSQEPKLFARSIRDNIAFGVASFSKVPSQEEIEEATKMANAHDFIMEFPDGYDTMVGDLGSKLSGGQKQRIAIARVLLRQPEILLLDEATSALDSESEQTVQNALDKLLSKDSSLGHSRMTTLVVAHRLATVRNADMIAVVDKGQIVETGTHDELMAIEGGGYNALVLAQQSSSSYTNSNHGSINHDSADEANNDEDIRASVFVPKDDKTLAESGNEIVLKDVHFHYPTRPESAIFRGINLAVKKGETLALVGPSGQGKSTIMQLIERYYDPTSGSIEFDGRDLLSLNIKYYRDQISMVSQEPTMFNDTVMANIRYGKPDATDEQVYEAAKKANAHNFISSFPDGYNTQLGETSLAVSGGQKQRIAIARAIIKEPRVLLLDEATSALDTASEQVVQEALDLLMQDHSRTTIVIAHRLSTIRNADRIAYISDGNVREIGTHDELMANPESKYKKLQELQNIGSSQHGIHIEKKASEATKTLSSKGSNKSAHLPTKVHEDDKVDTKTEKKVASKARLLAKDDIGFFVVGSIGAVLAGLMFPGWGIIFAYMIEYLYYPVLPCDEAAGIDPISPYTSCDDYIASVADTMRSNSFKLTYGWLAIIAAVMVGDILVYCGFGTASERMNKRVRDSAFTSMLRQEISYFDAHTVGYLTSQLSDDAALIHSFSGQPIRQLVMSLSSVLVGVVVSFVYMWPFALVSLAVLPFMGFGAEMEMKMYIGEDVKEVKEDEDGPGAIAVESLLNIRTVSSLSLEEIRLNDYTKALIKKNGESLSTTFKKCSLVASGQFIQMWGTALMFWWGGFVLWKWPDDFTYRGFLISMFSLLFSLSGLGMAAQGATDHDKAKAAGERIFELVERESAIDPLSNDGYKGE